jgi:DNA-binding MarR family transcriptional regulator
MGSYRLIQQLLTLAETFEKENGREATLPDFSGFLVSQLQTSPSGDAASEIRFGKKEQPAQELAYQLDNNISRLVIFINRYAKFYIKKALAGTPLLTPEGFTCLAILLTHGDLSKTELINFNIQEKTSGTVVISRLIKAGLIRESQNKSDKRGKRISITEEGRVLLYHIFEHTSHVGKIVTGKLTLEEKLTLQYLLQKLEDFHYPILAGKIINSKGDLEQLAESLKSSV